jgi:hypothetical protein
MEELEPAPEPLTCGTLSPDGAVLAYGGRQGVLHVRTPPRGDSVNELVHGADVALTGRDAGARGGLLVTKW